MQCRTLCLRLSIYIYISVKKLLSDVNIFSTNCKQKWAPTIVGTGRQCFHTKIHTFTKKLEYTARFEHTNEVHLPPRIHFIAFKLLLLNFPYLFLRQCHFYHFIHYFGVGRTQQGVQTVFNQVGLDVVITHTLLLFFEIKH